MSNSWGLGVPGSSEDIIIIVRLLYLPAHGYGTGGKRDKLPVEYCKNMSYQPYTWQVERHAPTLPLRVSEREIGGI